MLAIRTTNAPSPSPATHGTRAQSESQDLSDSPFCLTAIQSYAPRQRVYCQGDRAEHLFEVIGGVVKLYRVLADGRCQITGFLYPGQFLGLGTSDRYAQSAEALSTATLCRYQRSKLDSVIDRDPMLGSRLLSRVTNELLIAQDQLVLLGRKSAVERFCSFLVRLSTDLKRRGENPHRIYLPMTRRDIGDYLGLTTETISRTVGRLKDLFVIELSGFKEIVVLDPDRLESLATSEVGASAVPAH